MNMMQTLRLHRLRCVVLRNPAQAVVHLRRLTESALSAGLDAGLRIDLRILLAETSLRCLPTGADLRLRHITAALDACHEAAEVAGAMQPVDWPRLTVALGVGADIAVWAGLSRAVDACDGYVVAATNCDPPDERRVVFAGALRAVAVYHHIDCAQGRRLMATAERIELGRSRPAERAVAMFGAAVAAMLNGCQQPERHRVAGLPPALPGGVLDPGLDAPSPDHLAHRIAARPGTHSCR